MTATRRIFLLGCTALGLATSALAVRPTLAAMAKPQTIMLKGSLVCLACDLKSAHGAGAQCNVFGHQHALKTADGRYYTFLTTDKAQPLIKGEGMHYRPVEISGVLFPGSQVIEVSGYTAPRK